MPATSKSTIRFILDGETIEMRNVDPTRTVLKYLREDLGKAGTKEGCAEGDCGACTVVLAELDPSGEALTARAVNSCIQFLPTLDGRELITIESLKSADGRLHPVQQAMVDRHASQCGFCTPGFVMSLFALYKNNASPTRREIDDALSGNLCRCTGYRPIVDAAKSMYTDYAERQDPGDWLLAAHGGDAGAEKARVDSLRALQDSRSLALEGHGRKFFAPQDSAELAELMLDYPAATVLAGGTDVGLWVTKQHRQLDVVVYTGRVRELRALATTDTHLQIGAAVPLSDAMPLIVEHYPSLEEIFLRFASPPIRNAGTLGGNVANGSPIGDSMPALLALGSSLELRMGAERRTLLLEDFYLDYQKTALQTGEFVEQVLIPLPEVGARVESYKVSKRFDQDISAVCAAYRLKLEGDTVADIRIAYGGMAAIPRRAVACEQALLGRPWNAQQIEIGSNALAKDFTPLSDMRATAAYRQTVCGNLLQRFFFDTTDGAEPRLYAYGR